MLPLLRALLEFGVGDWSFLAFVVTKNWAGLRTTLSQKHTLPYNKLAHEKMRKSA